MVAESKCRRVLLPQHLEITPRVHQTGTVLGFCLITSQPYLQSWREIVVNAPNDHAKLARPVHPGYLQAWHQVYGPGAVHVELFSDVRAAVVQLSIPPRLNVRLCAWHQLVSLHLESQRDELLSLHPNCQDGLKNKQHLHNCQTAKREDQADQQQTRACFNVSRWWNPSTPTRKDANLFMATTKQINSTLVSSSLAQNILLLRQKMSWLCMKTSTTTFRASEPSSSPRRFHSVNLSVPHCKKKQTTWHRA